MARSFGRWRLIRSLDEGGQAWLYLVEDSTGALPGQYVLKRLKNPGRMDLFKREIEATSRLNHSNILRVVDFDTIGKEPYYVGEHCELGSLAKLAADTFRANIRVTVRLLLPIVDALAAAHSAQVIHRDVKPQNILMRADRTPVIGDFGICHIEGDERVTLSGEAMGSRDFIAPEMESGQRRRLGGPSPATDVYSLGKVVYWMLSGGKTFARENHRGFSLVELLGEQRWEHVHVLFERMIVEDPKNRVSIPAMPALLKETEALVVGDFMPLRPSMGLQCRWCGKGKYERYRGHPTLRSWIDELGGIGQAKVRVLRCTHCGYIELFDLAAGIENADWWDK